jgi:hypothetical protein
MEGAIAAVAIAADSGRRRKRILALSHLRIEERGGFFGSAAEREVPRGRNGGRVYAGSSKRLPYWQDPRLIFIALRRNVEGTTWQVDWRVL